MWQAFETVWRTRRYRRSIIVTAVTVATAVWAAHSLVGDGIPLAGWVALHALLPAVVFSSGYISTGCPQLDRRTVARGLATVSIVATSFTVINNIAGPLPLPLRLALNLAVPTIVATLGAASALSAAPTSAPNNAG